MCKGGNPNTLKMKIEQIRGNTNKLRSFKNSEHINEKGDGPYRGFGYLSLFSDPIDLAMWSQRELLYFCIL